MYHNYTLLFSGVWNVPLISVAILFNGDWLQRNSDNLPQYHSREYDPDMAFCQWMRDNVSECMY